MAYTKFGSIVVEPIGQIIARPDNVIGTRSLVNIDAQSLVFDSTNLFDWSKYSGYDQFETGLRANYGGQIAVNFKNGGFFNVVAGQSAQLAGTNSYATADAANVGLSSGLDTRMSDYVIGSNVSPLPLLSFGTQARFDSSTFEMRRLDATTTINLGALTGGIQFADYSAQPLIGYSVRREGLSFSAKYKFAEHYFVQGSVTFDMSRQNYPLYQIGYYNPGPFAVASSGLGVGYEDECTTFKVSYTSVYEDNGLGNFQRDQSVLVSLSLRTLGGPQVQPCHDELLGRRDEHRRRRRPLIQVSFSRCLKSAGVSANKDSEGRTTMALGFASILMRLATIAGMTAAALAATAAPASAQEVVVSVNGDPITSYDLDERMKLLRGLRKPAGRDAAIESLVSDRLMAREASKYGINISDEEIGSQIADDARKAKMSTAAYAAAASHTGASADHVRNHFKSELAYNVLIKGLNRGVEASESQIRSELAAQKGKASVHRLHDPPGRVHAQPSDGPAQVESTLKLAAALRTRFTSCDMRSRLRQDAAGRRHPRQDHARFHPARGGHQAGARHHPDRHLTAPTRSGNGIELIAVCGRGAPTNDDELRKQIGDRILSQHLEAVAAQRYRELRSTAVIERPRG